MRAPNFKAGWIIFKKIAGLTHFHADISPEDIDGVYAASEALLRSTNTKFHLIMDNRQAPMHALSTLEEMQSYAPLLQHPLLSYVLIIKPLHLPLEEKDKGLQESKGVVLKYVDSVEEAVSFLMNLEVLSVEEIFNVKSFFYV